MADIIKSIERKQNYVLLIKMICAKYNLDASISTNITNIHAFLKPLRADIIAAESNTLNEANQRIVDMYGEMIKRDRKDIIGDMNSIKDKLIAEISKPGDDSRNLSTAYDTFSNKESFTSNDILTMTPEKRIQAIKYLNYSSLFRDEYIVIDSRYRNLVNPDKTKIEFALITNTKTRSQHGGVIVGNPLQDIVEIEIYPFTIPYKPIYATFYNKMTLSINEWSSNAYEAYEGGQFHFQFDIDQIDNNLIYLKPVNNKYSFSVPVNRIDSFSLSFGAVYPKISFDSDRMIPSFISFTDALGLFTFSDVHNLVTGDLVYISGFNTPDPSRDVDVITKINRAEGHIIVKKDNHSFIINEDLTLVRRQVPEGSQIYPIDTFEQNVSIYFASKRVQIQMRLCYLTNYT